MECQSLEEINVYRHIVNINELFKNVEISYYEKNNMFESIILILIRYNNVMKEIYAHYENKNYSLRYISKDKCMFLEDYIELLENFEKWFPYL